MLDHLATDAQSQNISTDLVILLDWVCLVCDLLPRLAHQADQELGHVLQPLAGVLLHGGAGAVLRGGRAVGSDWAESVAGAELVPLSTSLLLYTTQHCTAHLPSHTRPPEYSKLTNQEITH